MATFNYKLIMKFWTILGKDNLHKDIFLFTFVVHESLGYLTWIISNFKKKLFLIFFYLNAEVKQVENLKRTLYNSLARPALFPVWRKSEMENEEIQFLYTKNSLIKSASHSKWLRTGRKMIRITVISPNLIPFNLTFFLLCSSLQKSIKASLNRKTISIITIYKEDIIYLYIQKFNDIKTAVNKNGFTLNTQTIKNKNSKNSKQRQGLHIWKTVFYFTIKWSNNWWFNWNCFSFRSDHPYTQGKENSSMTNRSENYEVVGPPLPVRPVSMQIPTAPPPDHPENVTNMLYHTMNSKWNVLI